MLDWLRQLVKNIDQLVWIIIIGVVAIIVIAFLLLGSGPAAGQSAGMDTVTPTTFHLTLEAAGTASNAYVPTISANLTQTPINAALTGAAPTLSLSGRQEVRQFAASAYASSEIDRLDQGAIQAVGPPNTEDCGDYRTAWASAIPNERASLTLLFAELVTPTGILIYQTYNPGFITRVEMTDIYGEIHVVYQASPILQAQCPFIRVIPVVDAEFKTSRMTIYVDQSLSFGGWNQIDAVELIGIGH